MVWSHIRDHFLLSFIGAYLATAVLVLRWRAVAQMKALLLLFNMSELEFDEAYVVDFLSDL